MVDECMNYHRQRPDGAVKETLEMGTAAITKVASKLTDGGVTVAGEGGEGDGLSVDGQDANALESKEGMKALAELQQRLHMTTDWQLAKTCVGRKCASGRLRDADSRNAGPTCAAEVDKNVRKVLSIDDAVMLAAKDTSKGLAGLTEQEIEDAVDVDASSSQRKPKTFAALLDEAKETARADIERIRAKRMAEASANSLAVKVGGARGAAEGAAAAAAAAHKKQLAENKAAAAAARKSAQALQKKIENAAKVSAKLGKKVSRNSRRHRRKENRAKKLSEGQHGGCTPSSETVQVRLR